MSEKQDSPRNDDGGADGHQAGGMDAAPDPGILPGAEVLPDIGCGGKPEGDRGKPKKAVKLVGGGKAGDKERTEAVDDRLDAQAAGGNHNVLQAERSAEAEQVGKAWKVGPPVCGGHL